MFDEVWDHVVESDGDFVFGLGGTFLEGADDGDEHAFVFGF